jgi:hypothetical protein
LNYFATIVCTQVSLGVQANLPSAIQVFGKICPSVPLHQISTGPDLRIKAEKSPLTCVDSQENQGVTSSR